VQRDLLSPARAAHPARLDPPGVRNQGASTMRYVYVALIVVLTAIVLLFKFQNLETVTVSLLASSFTLPVSVLVLLVYALGMLTGGFVLAFFRTLARGASRPAA
jgi:uncharacterized integral membrane protein